MAFPSLHNILNNTGWEEEKLYSRQHRNLEPQPEKGEAFSQYLMWQLQPKGTSASSGKYTYGTQQ